MTWVRLDDGAPLHPKLLAVGPEAAWLWVAGLAYANRHVTNGAIPPQALPALYPSDQWPRARLAKLAAALVEAGLWTAREGGGWDVHDYAQYQAEAMRDAVDERRAWERERKAKQRATQKHREPAVPVPSDSKGLPPMSPRDKGGTVPWDKGGTEGGTSAGDVRAPEAGVSQVVSQAPDPSRPVPEDVSLPHAGASVRTHEHTGLRVEELVAALRKRSKGAVLVSGASDTTVALTLQRTLTDLAAGPEAVTRADLDTLADWYGAGSQAFRGTPPGLREIASKGGTLAEHIEAARAWDRAGRPDPRATPSAPSRTPGAPGRPGSAPARPTKLRPAPCSPASAFADDNNPATDPLLGML
jgi:hypothetical protein